jgi:uncharacterized protein YjbJ (UPF0337 family)
MDKERVKGAIDQVLGIAKREAGNVIGDVRTQAEGTGLEIKGEFETAAGKLKDAARDARDKATASHKTSERTKREKSKI